MQSSEEKMRILFNLLCKVPVEQRPRLLICRSEDGKSGAPQETRLFCNHERLELKSVLRSLVEQVEPETGDILEFFSSLEFLTNAIISSFLEINDGKGDEFAEILDQLPWATKIKLLDRWKIVKKDTKEILMQLKEVRNQFAHQISPNTYSVFYCNAPLEENFGHFIGDLSVVWENLLEIYNNGLPDIDALITKYSEPILPSVK